MASDHVIALSHIVIVGGGLTLVALADRRITRAKPARVRAEYDAPRRAHPLRASVRLIGRLPRGTTRLALELALALATPVGVLCANGRYPLVAPVLAPFEARLVALGHRTGHARCFPLLAWRLWLVRCAGCRRRGVFREVPAAAGAGVELKVVGTSPWRTRRCPSEYLTARSAQAAGTARPAPPIRRRARPMQPVPAVRRAVTSAPVSSPSAATDKTA